MKERGADIVRVLRASAKQAGGLGDCGYAPACNTPRIIDFAPSSTFDAK